jgi:hypothetical protein
MRRWEQAKQSEGRVVLISGEPGIARCRISVSLSCTKASRPYACRSRIAQNARSWCRGMATHDPAERMLSIRRMRTQRKG